MVRWTIITCLVIAAGGGSVWLYAHYRLSTGGYLHEHWFTRARVFGRIAIVALVVALIAYSLHVRHS